MPARQTKKKSGKAGKAPFFPSTPSSVGSPRNDGFYPRTVRQRTPSRLCSLALPPPLVSLFSNASAAGGNDVVTATTGRMTSSDNVSLDGYSIIEGSTTARHRPSDASAVSASVASVGGVGSSGSSVHHTPHMPLHLRVGMAPCDPLLAFDGRYVLVATCDGRVAIYRIVDFGARISEDVEASERRRRAEWRKEDARFEARQREKLGLEEKKDESKAEAEEEEEEEENEAGMRERMHRREKARQGVEPILVVTLPRKNPGDDQNQVAGNSFDEESTISTGNILTPPTVVAMCTTDGTTLIEQREFSADEDRSEVKSTGSKPHIPSLGKELLGHVAVLTNDGEVHVLEFLLLPPSLSEAQGNDDYWKSAHHVPSVNFVVSFNTGILGATSVCAIPAAARTNSTETEVDLQPLQICVGHQSGALTAFQVYSRCIRPRLTKVHTSPEKVGKHLSPVASFNETETKEESHEQSKFTSPLTRSKSNDFQQHASPAKARPPAGRAAPRALFRSTETAAAPSSNKLGEIAFQRTLSEPIPAAADSEDGELGQVAGPARVALRWKGQYDVPIRSLSSPGRGPREEEEARMEVPALLVVGIVRRQHVDAANWVPMNGTAPSTHHSLSPAISLEVMNATLAETMWRRIKTEAGMNSRHDGRRVNCYDCSVWPAAGREIKDGWMRGASRRGMDPKDELFGALGLQRTSVTSRICSFDSPDPCFVSASSDGTVAISHCYPSKGQWGVMEEDNQVMFCERCIGIGDFDYGTDRTLDHGFDGRYVVCCLRGGTIYLVPVGEPGANASVQSMGQNHIYQFTIPLDPDGDDDGLVRLVHSFSAGMVRCDGGRTNEILKSVAMVGWPGGIIDVYELSPGRKKHSTEALLGELLINE